MTAEVVYKVSSKQNTDAPATIARVVLGYVVGCDQTAGNIMRERRGLTGATDDDVVSDPLQILNGLKSVGGRDLGP